MMNVQKKSTNPSPFPFGDSDSGGGCGGTEMDTGVVPVMMCRPEECPDCIWDRVNEMYVCTHELVETSEYEECLKED